MFPKDEGRHALSTCIGCHTLQAEGGLTQDAVIIVEDCVVGTLAGRIGCARVYLFVSGRTAAAQDICGLVILLDCHLAEDVGRLA